MGIRNTGPPNRPPPLWPSPFLALSSLWPTSPFALPAPQDLRRLSRSGRRAGRSAGQTSSKASKCCASARKPRNCSTKTFVCRVTMSSECNEKHDKMPLTDKVAPHCRGMQRNILPPLQNSTFRCHLFNHYYPPRSVKDNRRPRQSFRSKPNDCPRHRCCTRPSPGPPWRRLTNWLYLLRRSCVVFNAVPTAVPTTAVSFLFVLHLRHRASTGVHAFSTSIGAELPHVFRRLFRGGS